MGTGHHLDLSNNAGPVAAEALYIFNSTLSIAEVSLVGSGHRLTQSRMPTGWGRLDQDSLLAPAGLDFRSRS